MLLPVWIIYAEILCSLYLVYPSFLTHLNPPFPFHVDKRVSQFSSVSLRLVSLYSGSYIMLLLCNSLWCALCITAYSTDHYGWRNEGSLQFEVCRLHRSQLKYLSHLLFVGDVLISLNYYCLNEVPSLSLF